MSASPETILSTCRYYISSLPGDNAARLASAVRWHRGVENCLHRPLDVGFREGDYRVRARRVGENFAVIRQIAHDLIKAEKAAKVGEKTKRLMAGWDDDYLLKILLG